MRSIGFKIWLGFMGFLALIMGVIALCLVTWLAPAYESWYVRETQRSVEGAFVSDKVDAVTAASRLESLYRGQVLIVSEDGGLLYQSDMLPSARSVTETVGALSYAGQENGVRRIVNPRTNLSYDLIWQRIELEAGPAAAFVVVPEQSLRDTSQFLLVQFLLVALALIPLVSVTALLLARRFSRPIRRIQQATLALSEGKLDTRVEVRNADEIGLLSQSINKLAEQLGQVEQLRRELIANVSHELRTPLTLIQGYAEVLQDVPGDDEALRREYVDIILSETERLKTLVRDVLDYSQLQSRAVKLKPEPIDLSGLMGELCGRYAQMGLKKRIRYGCGIEPGVEISADRQRLLQVVHNILSNAFNHVNPDGEVAVRLYRTDGTAKLEVENTADSPPDAEALSHVFERYYRNGKGPYAGTGLGLAIVKSILDAHGFRYGMHVTGSGGVRFFVEFERTADGRP